MISPNAAPVKSPSLDQIIGWIESRNNPEAIRFEPRVYAGARAKSPFILSRIKRANLCSDDTAAMIYSTSFGEFQVMGENLYNAAIDYSYSIGEFFNDVAAQKLTFYKFANANKIAYTAQDLLLPYRAEHFALIYNGALAYAQNIREALRHFGVLNP